MRIVVAPDSFKECASAADVAAAIADGVRRAAPAAEIVAVPMADGGEGTVDALVAATGGTRVECPVAGPLGDPVTAAYGLLGDGATAVIEMAAASGLALVPVERRDPCRATTRGTGELIRDALDRGVDAIVIGIGGSATNDGGAGMAQALGYSLLDSAGNELPPGGAALARLARIDASARHPRLAPCRIQVACDVTNPLCGPHGASYVYGPQKGAAPEAAAELDAALARLATVVAEQLGTDVRDLPGAGAAGGLGAGLVAFAGGELRSGVELVAEACGLDEAIRDAALVITGEGALDGQSAHGKTPVGVARIARQYGVPVVALAGALGAGYKSLYASGINAAFSICDGPMPLDRAVREAPRLLREAAEAAVRLWLAAEGRHA
ncbi:MAG: glycerate kinase [Candidatus Hydrogenedentes bacterium]|nr:glycerate kinase [Candidatus Hydrogenedentota bacterium]